MSASGGSPGAAALPFEQALLERYLHEHIEGFAGPLQVTRFKGGQSNPTFLLDTPDRRYVMRSKPGPASQLLPSAHAVEREFRVQHALAGSTVPVAAMLSLCEDEAVLGRAFYIMEHVEGRIFWEQALPGLAPLERGALYHELNRVIAELHGVDIGATGLSDYGKGSDYFARQIRRWSAQYLASQTGANAAMDNLIAWLPAHVPAEDAPQVSLVHGDYRIDNVIFHPTQPRILAVIDWELSTLGHPLADFAYHLMSWHIPPGPLRGLAGLDLADLGIPDQSAYIAQYERRSGRRVSGDMNFYLAYNLFRLAAILQGIAKRVEEGTASSTQATEYGRQARPLAELGWRFAQQAST
ncbi:MAG: phosphotransferase [Pseudomonadota bacterium]|nr:phosphotransferase [Pseudomonadota bacterium]